MVLITGSSQAMSMYYSNGLIVMSGKVVKGDLKKFNALMIKYPNVKEVRMNSAGGMLSEGIKLGQRIRYKRLNTYVNNRSYCASACTKIFLGGIQRIVQKGGSNKRRLGFHASGTSYDAEDTLQYIFEYGQYVYAITANYYASMISSTTKIRNLLKFHKKVLSRNDASIVVWPSIQKLSSIGYVTHTRKA